METIVHKLPITRAERELEPDELRVPATLDEFWELAETVDYRVEYLNGEIISSTSQASDVHETLTVTLGWLFNNYYHDLADYRVPGSNVLIFSEAATAGLNADLSVVRGPSDHKVLSSGRLSKSIIKSPEIVVEVLSPSTRNYDITEKLAAHKTIPPLQHVLFVDQRKPAVAIYSRLPEPKQWLTIDYNSLTDTAIVGDLTLPIADIYRKTLFSTLI